MDPLHYKRNGREYGNAAYVGEMLGIKPDTFQWYVRESKPSGNPPPAHDMTDNATGQRMYALKAVRAWNEKRTGRGNWNGIGARARKPKDEQPADEVEQVTGEQETAEILADPDTMAAVDEARTEQQA